MKKSDLDSLSNALFLAYILACEELEELTDKKAQYWAVSLGAKAQELLESDYTAEDIQRIRGLIFPTFKTDE